MQIGEADVYALLQIGVNGLNGLLQGVNFTLQELVLLLETDYLAVDCGHVGHEGIDLTSQTHKAAIDAYHLAGQSVNFKLKMSVVGQEFSQVFFNLIDQTKQVGHIGLEDDDIGLEGSHVGLEDGDVGCHYVDFEEQCLVEVDDC